MNAMVRMKVLADNLVGWLSTLEDLIAASCYLLHVSSHFRTPLLNLVYWFLFEIKYQEELQLPLLLNIWLESLRTCGVDLEEYGRAEVDLFQQGLVDWGSDWWETWRITSFEYGSSPNDWSIEVEQLSDSSSDSPGNMPGGWIEDDQSGGEADVVDEDDLSGGEADVVDEGEQRLQQEQSVRAHKVSIRWGPSRYTEDKYVQKREGNTR